jgi:hypothetical protein
MRRLSIVATLGFGASAFSAEAQNISMVGYWDVFAPHEEAFWSALSPQQPIEGVLHLRDLAMAERFQGQSVQPLGDFDVITGGPSGPLVLLPGLPNQNLCPSSSGGYSGIAGLSHRGYVDAGIGEGAMAMLFGLDQSKLAFDFRGHPGWTNPF